MNEPIINPWFIYLINVIEPLYDLIHIVAGVSFIIIVLTEFVKLLAISDKDNDVQEFARKVVERCVPILMIFTLACLFVPSRNTLIAMYVAKHVTVETVTKTGDVVEEMLNRILKVSESKSDNKSLKRVK